MQVFHCDHCGQLLFFENTECVSCGHRLAYLPDLGVVGSLKPIDETTLRSPLPRAAERAYKLCLNYAEQQVCYWALAADDPHDLCVACRLTRTIPEWAWMGADEVAREGYMAAEANRAACVPGAPNKTAASLLKVLPDDWVMELEARQRSRFLG